MPRERIGEVELYYEIQGEGESVVAFVNGVAMTVQSWGPILEHFRQDFRCVLHDCRGQLMSEKPAMDYSMEIHARDLRNLLDHLAIPKVHLVGTSYGSEIAMVFAYLYPDRVETLHVIAGVSELNALLYAATESWAVSVKYGAEPFFSAMIPWVYSNSFLEEHRSVLKERAMALAALPGDYFEGFVRLVEAFQRLDITEQLEGIRCPTLVISAENDLVKPPEFGEIIHRSISDSEFVVMPDAGHAVVVEDPDGVSELVRAFIEKQTLRARPV